MKLLTKYQPDKPTANQSFKVTFTDKETGDIVEIVEFKEWHYSTRLHCNKIASNLYYKDGLLTKWTVSKVG